MKDKLNSRQGPPITSAELHVHLCTIVKGLISLVKGLICKFESSAVAKNVEYFHLLQTGCQGVCLHKKLVFMLQI